MRRRNFIAAGGAGLLGVFAVPYKKQTRGESPLKTEGWG